MTHTYSIQGMTCNNCLAKVRDALLGIAGVTHVEVTLSPPQAVVSMSSHVGTSTLAQAVTSSGKFTLSGSDQSAALHETSIAEHEESDSFKPIYLLFGYIAGTATLIELAHGDGFQAMRWMGAFMAAFFLLFSFFKLLDVRGFAEGYSTYDIVARRVPSYGLLYPFIELGLGIAYVLAPMSPITNVLALVVMGVSSIGVVQSVLRNSPFQCACLGTIFKLPLSKITLFEDLLMVAMSAGMLLFSSLPNT